MIDSRELRIGNYIHDLTGGLCIVRGVTSKGIYIRDDAGPGGENAFTGIKLTEDWLIDLGFETNKTDVDIDGSQETYYTLELNNDIYCHLSFISGDKNGFLEICLFPYEEWFRYCFVHQLQNLYFDLTGQELTLNTAEQNSSSPHPL